MIIHRVKISRPLLFPFHISQHVRSTAESVINASTSRNRSNVAGHLLVGRRFVPNVSSTRRRCWVQRGGSPPCSSVCISPSWSPSFSTAGNSPQTRADTNVNTGFFSTEAVHPSSSSFSSSSSNSTTSTATASRRALPADFISSLQSKLPHLSISTNKYELQTHGKDESFHPPIPPDAVCTPPTTTDIVEIVKHCREYRVPIIPYGAGTSLEGHVGALRGGISLDMTLFDDIELTSNTEDGGMMEDFYVRVGAGVTRKKLNEALRHTGMHFTVDPGADATIGGMVACGASGTTAVKYGTMRENILGLECVLPDGTVATCGTNALKSSAGYDLTSLMTGSEGTLGIITKITVKLHPIPENVTAAVCSFDDLHDAAAAVAAMRMCDIPLERCELLDTTSVAAFNEYVQATVEGGDAMRTMEVKPTLFLEFTGITPLAVQEQVDLSQSICTDEFSGSNFAFTSVESDRKALWSARHKLYYATLALRPGAAGALITDACVPLSKFADLIAATAADVRELDVIGPMFGHAGDGNFHCILPLLEDDTEEYVARVHQVNDHLIQRTLAVGGTCTGEHGVGYGKIKYLERQYGQGGVEMMKAIKKAIDPLNIMNPGKIVLI